ncbi:MAG: Yip1 family protein, partial [Sphingomonadaceae bacterium]
MNPGDPVSVPPSLVDRVKNILLKPKEEWPKIDAEPATIGGIYTSYVLPIAAIPAIAGAIGALAFGYSLLGISYRPSATSVLGMAITQYVLALVGVFVLGLIIDWLAPTFGGVKNNVQAFKVAAYSATAGWVAGILSIIPALAVLGGLLGLYSLYLLYLGLPRLMKAPQDKALSYTVVTIIAAIVIFIVMGMLTRPIGGMFGSPLASNEADVSGTINVPGAG